MDNDQALKKVIGALFEMERRATHYTYGMSTQELNDVRDRLETLRQELKQKGNQ